MASWPSSHSPAPTPIGERTDAGAYRRLAGAIMTGFAGVLLVALSPVLFVGLVEQHRLTLSQLGLAYAIVTLVMGCINVLAGIFLTPKHLKLRALIAVVLVVGLGLWLMRASGVDVLLICALLGIPQGLLLWIAMGGVVTLTRLPAKAMAIWVTSITLTELALSTLLANVVLPHAGIDGGFYFVIAAAAIAGLGGACLVPSVFHGLSDRGDRAAGVPPVRGWVALAAAALVTSSMGAVTVYMLPLAQDGGMSVAGSRNALSALLAGQVTGSTLAFFLAARLRYAVAIGLGASIALTAWALMASGGSAWLIITCACAHGMTATFNTAFLMPMLIDADTTRRASAQMGSATLLGGALGPFLSSRAVEHFQIQGALIVAASCLVAGAILIFGLRPPP